MMRATIVSLCVLVVGTVGCGEGGPTLVPVTGKVMVNGKPLAEAQIAFLPDPTNTDLTPGASTTDPEGGFTARYNNRPGLAPGKYSVKVSKTEELPGKTIPPEFKYDKLQQKMAGFAKETLAQDFKQDLVVSTSGEKGLEFDFKPAKK